MTQQQQTRTSKRASRQAGGVQTPPQPSAPHCHNPRHAIPCPLPCAACEAECSQDTAAEAGQQLTAGQDTHSGGWDSISRADACQCGHPKADHSIAGLMSRRYGQPLPMGSAPCVRAACGCLDYRKDA